MVRHQYGNRDINVTVNRDGGGQRKVYNRKYKNFFDLEAKKIFFLNYEVYVGKKYGVKVLL